MRNEQRIVAVGAATGVISMIIGVFGIYRAWPAPEDGLAAAAEACRLYLCNGRPLPPLPLLVAVITVGNNRFLSEAIDPTLNKEDQATQINGRVVENTLQQLVLFVLEARWRSASGWPQSKWASFPRPSSSS